MAVYDHQRGAVAGENIGLGGRPAEPHPRRAQGRLFLLPSACRADSPVREKMRGWTDYSSWRECLLAKRSHNSSHRENRTTRLSHHSFLLPPHPSHPGRPAQFLLAVLLPVALRMDWGVGQQVSPSTPAHRRSLLSEPVACRLLPLGARPARCPQVCGRPRRGATGGRGSAATPVVAEDDGPTSGTPPGLPYAAQLQRMLLRGSRA